MRNAKALLILLCITVPAVVFAGLSYVDRGWGQVVVSDTGGNGVVSVARHSPDLRQYIACSVQASYGFCIAMDEDGNSASCNTTDPGMLRAMASVNSTSLIVFSHPAGSSTCGYLYVENGSPFLW